YRRGKKMECRPRARDACAAARAPREPARDGQIDPIREPSRRSVIRGGHPRTESPFPFFAVAIFVKLNGDGGGAIVAAAPFVFAPGFCTTTGGLATGFGAGLGVGLGLTTGGGGGGGGFEIGVDVGGVGLDGDPDGVDVDVDVDVAPPAPWSA